MASIERSRRAILSRPLFGRRVSLLALFTGLTLAHALLSACATTPTELKAIETLPPLQLDDETVEPAQALQQIDTPPLLEVDDEMREFVERYTEGIPRGRQRLLALHRAVRGSATLGVEYDPAAEGSAIEVFHRGSANCLSYATLFVALAREAGLQADYQWLRMRPAWTKRGERVMVRLHVNVLVKAGRHDKFMVDIDPVPTREIAGTRLISDLDAQALYHSNIAMEALAAQDLTSAWMQSVKALELSPGMSHLWVNLGAVYRHVGQHRVAERSYLHALQLDPYNDSAMNNLVILYAMEGREEERAFWDAKVSRYRDANPYYHAWLGDRAADEADWQQALAYYEKALELLPQDSRLLFAMGNAHYALDRPMEATGYIRRAIDHATLRTDIDNYQLRLRAIERGDGSDRAERS